METESNSSLDEFVERFVGVCGSITELFLNAVKVMYKNPENNTIPLITTNNEGVTSYKGLFYPAITLDSEFKEKYEAVTKSIENLRNYCDELKSRPDIKEGVAARLASFLDRLPEI